MFHKHSHSLKLIFCCTFFKTQNFSAFPHEPRPRQTLEVPHQSWEETSLHLFLAGLGEREHFSVLAAYISTQSGNGHENRLKPLCNSKFIPLSPWTHQPSRETHGTVSVRITSGVSGLVKSLINLLRVWSRMWLSGDRKERFQIYRNENERVWASSRGWDADRSFRKQDKGTRPRQIRKRRSDWNPFCDSAEKTGGVYRHFYRQGDIELSSCYILPIFESGSTASQRKWQRQIKD